MMINYENININQMELNNKENKQKQKIKTKKQRYREKRRQRGNSSENVLSPIDPNTLIALKSYIKFVDEQIDQTTVCKVNVMDDEVEDQKVDQNVVSNIIINETTTIEDIQSIKETKNNVIVHEIEEIQSNITTTINEKVETDDVKLTTINEKVETDDVKLTSQLNNSLSNGLLVTSINNRINRYGFTEYEIIITDKSFIQPINDKLIIHRRYNDFFVVNALLMASGFKNLPSLPRKQFFKFIHDENFLNERQLQLDNYLKTIINLYPIQSAGVKNLIKTFLSAKLTAIEGN